MAGSVSILESEWRREAARFSISGPDEIFSIIVACLGASADLIQSVASIILITKTHRAGRSALLTEALTWPRLLRAATFEGAHAYRARANMQHKLVALTGSAS